MKKKNVIHPVKRIAKSLGVARAYDLKTALWLYANDAFFNRVFNVLA